MLHAFLLTLLGIVLGIILAAVVTLAIFGFVYLRSWIR